MEETLKDYRFFYKELIKKSFWLAIIVGLLLYSFLEIPYLNGYLIGYLLGVFNFYLLARDVEIFGKKDRSKREAQVFSFSRYGLRFFTILVTAYFLIKYFSNLNFIFLAFGFFTIKVVIYFEFVLKKKFF